MSYEEERAELVMKAEEAMGVNNIQLSNDYMDKIEKLDAKHKETIEAEARLEELNREKELEAEMAMEAEIVASANEAAMEEPQKIEMSDISVNPTNVVAKERINFTMTNFDERNEILASKEYHDAYFMNLMGRATAEQIAMLDTGSGSAGAAVPLPTQNRIQEALAKVAGVISRAEIMNIPGMMRVPYESTFNQAALHTENANISATADVLSYLPMPTYELTKLLPLSANLEATSIEALEDWVVNSLYRGVLYKADAYAISGSGSSQPAGIESITFTDTVNAVAWAGASLAYADLAEGISLLPAIYDNGASIIMNKKTYWTAVRGLALGSTYDQVVENGKLLGYDVCFDDLVADNVIYVGNIREGLKVNMPGGITVKNDLYLRTNSHDFLGAANFACNVIPNAFVKIAATL